MNSFFHIYIYFFLSVNITCFHLAQNSTYTHFPERKLRLIRGISVHIFIISSIGFLNNVISTQLLEYIAENMQPGIFLCPCCF